MTVVTEPVVPGTTAGPPAAYGSGAKWFHWVTTTLILIAMPVGFVIQYIKDDHKMPFYAVHESAGVTIFLVALARLAWRLRHPAPPLPEHVPRLMQRVATGVHHALYVLLILQPVLGFVATNAWGFPLRGQTAYLGFIDLPKFMETNEPLAGLVQFAHNTLAWTMLALLVLHVGGAVYHQAIRRDGILLRMI